MLRLNMCRYQNPSCSKVLGDPSPTVPSGVQGCLSLWDPSAALRKQLGVLDENLRPTTTTP